MINIRRNKGKSLEDLVESTIPKNRFSKVIWSTFFIVSSLLGLSTATRIFRGLGQGDTGKSIDAIYYSEANEEECRRLDMDIITVQCLRPSVKIGKLEVNSDGVWGQEVTTPKPGNIYRIGCFGASTTAGNRSRDYIDAWPEHLQNIINESSRKGINYQVINFGVASTNSRFSLARFLKFGKKYELDIMIFDCGALWSDACCNAFGEKNDLLEKFLFSGNASLLNDQPWFRQNLNYWQRKREERMNDLTRFSHIKNILDDRMVFSKVNSSYVKCYYEFKEKKKIAWDEMCKVDEDSFIRNSNDNPSVFGNVPIDITINTEYAANIIQMVTYALDNNIKPVLFLNLMGDRCSREDTEEFRKYYTKCDNYDLTPAEWSAHMVGPVKYTMKYIGTNYNIPIVDPFRRLTREEICRKFSPIDFMHLDNEGYKELAKTLIPVVKDASESKLGDKK